jgi:PAS domain S-box-containing protein
MLYDFTLLCYIRFLSGLFALFVTGALWKRRKSNGATYLMLFEIAAAIWAISDGFESASLQPGQKIIWAQLSYLGISTSTAFFLLFSIDYANHGGYRKLRTFIFLMIIPVVTLIVVFTNSYHHFLWARIEFIEADHKAVYYYGPYFWIQAFYQYAMLIFAIIILLRSSLKVYSRHRAQFWIIIAGSLFPFAASISYVFKLIPVKGFDPTPVSFIFSGFIVTYAIFWYRMFNIMPIAREQAIDNLRDGIIVVDSSGMIVDANPAFSAMTGQHPGWIIGTGVDDFLNSAGITRSAFSAANDYTAEARMNIFQEEQDFELKYHDIKDAAGRILGGIFMLSNITTRKMIIDAIADSNKRRKQELVEKEKLIMDLDAYARSVAHDLKNPMGSIVGLSEMIRERLAENDLEDIDEMAEIVCQQSRKMVRIIEGLLMLSRIRKEDIVKTPVDTGPIIVDVMKRLNNEIVTRNAVLHMPDKWPEVLANGQWIEEVWSNLISNALKYGGRPPVIDLGFEYKGKSRIRFWIRDNGNGLPESSLTKIFMDFERLGVTDTDGYGLGLPIVKRIFEKLGEEIIVESTNKPGEGCIFSFILEESGKEAKG